MKQFFKFVLATVVGLIITTVIIVGIIVVLILAAAGSDNSNEVDSDSVLHIVLSSSIPERTPDNKLPGFLSDFGGDNKTIGLNDILANIKKAKTDDNIKGIFLDESDSQAGEATIEEIRNALIDFKTSGKFIIAYSEAYDQSFYYLASVADKIYLNPKGDLEFKGFSQQITFLKGALDKLGIEAQIIKVGTYKSALI
jgi:protease-4